MRYYVPFEGERIYFDSDAYCCPCNYRRIVADLPTLIYYRTDDGVAVNLYTESNAEFYLDNDVKLKLRQETDYPNSGQVTFKIDISRSSEFSMKFRMPTKRLPNGIKKAFKGTSFSSLVYSPFRVKYDTLP